METSSKWKATALLTWLLAAESAYCLPRVGTAVEDILQNTATEPARAFETQYPPSNNENRLLIPVSQPVYRFGLETDGRPPQPPFPPFEVAKIVHVLEGLIGAGHNTTTALVPTATGHTYPAEATTSVKQSGNPAPVPTTESVKNAPEGLIDASHNTTTAPVSTATGHTHPAEAITSVKQSGNPAPVLTTESVKNAPEGLIDASHNTTTAPVPTATGHTHPAGATTSVKQPGNPAPVPTTESVKEAPKAEPGTTSATDSLPTIPQVPTTESVKESPKAQTNTTSATDSLPTIPQVPTTESVKESPKAQTNTTSATDSLPTIPPVKPDIPKTMNGQDIFQPVATGPAPANIKSRDDHPVQNQHANSTDPIETNKFYAGLFLGSQTNATFTQPYSLAWSKGGGTLKSWGMGISHVPPHMLAWGPKNHKIPGDPVSYYINPVGLQHLIFSATELGDSTIMNTEQPKAFSAHAVIKRSAGSAQQIAFPIVQGMGYATAVYNDLQPLIESGVFFRKVVSAGSPRPGIFKYKVELEDETTWLMYATPADGHHPKFRLVSNSNLRGPHGFSGSIQIAKNPAGVPGEKFYDNSSGVYPVAGHISGAVTGDVGSYSLSWTKAGKDVQDTPLLMFALPHHVHSFDRATKGRATNIQLRTTTKGNATAVIGESWTMVEQNLPIDMGFAPWSTIHGSVQELSGAAQHTILESAPYELKQNISEQSDLNSMYYSGKALSKFATLVYTVNQLGNNVELATDAFQELKKSFARFVDNQQQYPLAYDAVWKGVVSTAGYNGDLNQDFGNTAYNDHHFHYGYFIQAAAIIGSLDPAWLAANKEWVNMLVRDAGNSVENDAYFPFSRGFDWYNGHSWAKGLFESFDGKDQESTSEDTMFAYAIKMWGQTTRDASMEARGNMMLGILGRSLNNYFLMEEDNVNQPANFIGNKVTGILFENKVDHTTYFGANLEFVQGIHMLPLMPHSPYTRRKEFVRQEWEAMFAENASTPASQVDGGWRGVLYANLALIDPKSSWEFFAQPNFNYSWIDGGATRTWYLAFAAGLGGAP